MTVGIQTKNMEVESFSLPVTLTKEKCAGSEAGLFGTKSDKDAHHFQRTMAWLELRGQEYCKVCLTI